MPEIEFHVEDEWTAVYLDGELQRVGDSYLADEWMQERFGVKVIHDGAFMRGQQTCGGVAKTLDEVEAYRAERDAKRARQRELQAEIDRLQAELGGPS